VIDHTYIGCYVYANTVTGDVALTLSSGDNWGASQQADGSSVVIEASGRNKVIVTCGTATWEILPNNSQEFVLFYAEKNWFPRMTGGEKGMQAFRFTPVTHDSADQGIAMKFGEFHRIMFTDGKTALCGVGLPPFDANGSPIRVMHGGGKALEKGSAGDADGESVETPRVVIATADSTSPDTIIGRWDDFFNNNWAFRNTKNIILDAPGEYVELTPTAFPTGTGTVDQCWVITAVGYMSGDDHIKETTGTMTADFGDIIVTRDKSDIQLPSVYDGAGRPPIKIISYQHITAQSPEVDKSKIHFATDRIKDFQGKDQPDPVFGTWHGEAYGNKTRKLFLDLDKNQWIELTPIAIQGGEDEDDTAFWLITNGA
jgi:hypothetical protein